MKKKLKIGLVFDDSLDKNDGVQQYVKTLGRWLIEQGHDVKFLVGQTVAAGDLQSRVHSLSRNVEFRGNQNKMFLPIFSSRKQIKHVLREEKFDILHIMMPSNPLMGSRVVKYAKNTPVIGTFHMVGGTRFINFGAYLLALVQRLTLSRINAFLSVSEAAQSFEKQYFRIESQISPNMVDIENFKKGIRLANLRGRNGTLVFLGRLVERKGARHLIESLKILKDNNQLDGVLTHICGDGELRSGLEEYVNSNGLADNVIFHGFIDNTDKPDYLASVDVAIFPSTAGEAFGIVLIEAMATNKCVVLGGNNDGYKTVLGAREELLFDPQNHKLLADKIKHYLDDKKSAARAVAWQTKEVTKYDVSKVGSGMELRYRELINTLRN